VRRWFRAFVAMHIADSARLKSAAWNGRQKRRSPVPVRLDRGRLHLLSREPGSEIGCLPPACGAPSSEGHLHPVRLTATATLTSAGLCQMTCSRQPSNRPQGGPIRVCGGIATHRPRPRSVRPPQDHLPPAGGHSAVLARRSGHPCNLRGSRRRLRCGKPGRAQRNGMVAARRRHGGQHCFVRCLIVCASRTSTVGHRPGAGRIQRRHG
jgi:hypothetical protein